MLQVTFIAEEYTERRGRKILVIFLKWSFCLPKEVKLWLQEEVWLTIVDLSSFQVLAIVDNGPLDEQSFHKMSYGSATKHSTSNKVLNNSILSKCHRGSAKGVPLLLLSNSCRPIVFESSSPNTLFNHQSYHSFSPGLHCTLS